MKARRVVTGFNKEGKSCIKWDNEIAPINLRPGFDNTPLWATKKLPAETTEEDPNTWDLGTSLAGGSVFRLGTYAPGNVARWHRTDSVDYAICPFRGAVDANGRRRSSSEAGRYRDPARHQPQLVNRGTVPCVMAFILIATEGGKTTGW